MKLENWLSNDRTRGVLVFGVSLAALLCGLWDLEITRINCRYALMAAEYHWTLFPTLNNAPYTDYPATMILLTHLSTLGGRVLNMFTLSLPNAVTGALTVFLTYCLGEKLRRGMGLTAAALLFLSWEFIAIARAPGLDMPVAALTVGLVLLLYTADRERRYRRLWWIPAFYLAGYLVRGPFGVLLPAAAQTGYFLARREWKRMFFYGAVAGLSGAAAFTAWLWAVWLEGGRDLVWVFFEDQIVSRMDSLKNPVYYFTNAVGSFAPAYPLALAVFALAWEKLIAPPQTGREVRFFRIAFWWFAVIAIGLSLPGTKHLRYLTPAIPALALAGAWGLTDFTDSRRLRILRGILLTACRWLPAALLAGTVGVFAVGKILRPELRIPLVTPGVVLLVLALWSLSLRKQTEDRRKRLQSLGLGAAAFAAFQILQLTPLDARLQSARDFAARFDRLRGDRPVRFLNMGPDGDEFKLLVNLPRERRFHADYVLWFPGPPPPPVHRADRPLRVRLRSWIAPGDKPRPPMFDVKVGLNNLENPAPGVLYVARVRKLAGLAGSTAELAPRFRVLHVGRMGHQEFVVFEAGAGR